MTKSRPQQLPPMLSGSVGGRQPTINRSCRNCILDRFIRGCLTSSCKKDQGSRRVASWMSAVERAASIRWPEAQLIGVDPAKEMVSQANRLCPGAAFKLAPAELLPLPDESADIVLSSISFHHWADQKKGLREIARVLRPGGLFCLADHTMLLSKLWSERVKTRRQIRALMMGAGLAVRKCQRLPVRFVLITLAQKGPSGAS